MDFGFGLSNRGGKRSFATFLPSLDGNSLPQFSIASLRRDNLDLSAGLTLQEMTLDGVDITGDLDAATPATAVDQNTVATGAKAAGAAVLAIADDSAMVPGTRWVLYYDVTTLGGSAPVTPAGSPFSLTEQPRANNEGHNSVLLTVRPDYTPTGGAVTVLEAGTGTTTFNALALYRAEWISNSVYSENRKSADGVRSLGTGYQSMGSWLDDADRVVGGMYEFRYEITAISGDVEVGRVGAFGNFVYDLPATVGEHRVVLPVLTDTGGVVIGKNGTGTMDVDFCTMHRYTPAAGKVLRGRVAGLGTAGRLLTRDVFVDTTGDDITGDGTETTPWATPQRAAGLAAPGDTIYLAPGTYPGFVVRSAMGGTASHPVKFTTAPADTHLAVVDGQNFDEQAARGIDVWHTDHIHIENLTVQNFAGNCIRFTCENAPDGEVHGGYVVRNCVVSKSGESGILIEGYPASEVPDMPLGTVRIRDVLIELNDVSQTNMVTPYNTGGTKPGGDNECITAVGGVADVVTRYNDVHDSRQYGIDYKHGILGGAIYGNRIWNILQYGLYLDCATRDLEDIEVYDNRVWGCNNGIALAREGKMNFAPPDPADRLQTMRNITIRDNWFWDCGTTGLFVDEHPGDGPYGVWENMFFRRNVFYNCGRRGAGGNEINIDDLSVLQSAGHPNGDGSSTATIANWVFEDNVAWRDPGRGGVLVTQRLQTDPWVTLSGNVNFAGAPFTNPNFVSLPAGTAQDVTDAVAAGYVTPANYGQWTVGAGLLVNPNSYVEGDPEWEPDGFEPYQTEANGDGVDFSTSEHPLVTAANSLPDVVVDEGDAVNIDTTGDFTNATSYALAPSSAALPVGLSFAAGVISGAPTTATAARALVVRGSNPHSFADSAFSLTVNAPAVALPVTANASLTSIVSGEGVNFNVTLGAGWPADSLRNATVTWDFDDPTAAFVNHPAGSEVDSNANAAIGPYTSHVFETAGTFDVTVTVRDWLGHIGTATIQITVEDADVTYAGNTVTVGDTGQGDDYDAGDLYLAVNWANSGTWRRIQLRRGVTFNRRGPLYVATDRVGTRWEAFGSGALPKLVLDETAPLNPFTSDALLALDQAASRTVIKEIAFEGVYDPTDGTTNYSSSNPQWAAQTSALRVIMPGTGSPTQHATFNKVKMRGLSRGVAITGDTGGAENIIINDVDFSDWYDYGVFGEGDGVSIVGGTIAQNPLTFERPGSFAGFRDPNQDPARPNYAFHGPIRIVRGLRTVVQKVHLESWNGWSGATGGIAHQPCLRLFVTPDADDANSGSVSQNHMKGGYSILALSPIDSAQGKRPGPTVIENNYLEGSAHTLYMVSAKVAASIRNNLLYMPDVTPIEAGVGAVNNPLFAVLDLPGAGPQGHSALHLAANMDFYHNTAIIDQDRSQRLYVGTGYPGGDGPIPRLWANLVQPNYTNWVNIDEFPDQSPLTADYAPEVGSPAYGDANSRLAIFGVLDYYQNERYGGVQSRGAVRATTEPTATSITASLATNNTELSIGTELTASLDKAILPKPIDTIAYQHMRNGVDVPGATGASHTITETGSPSVRVTVTTTDGTTYTDTSETLTPSIDLKFTDSKIQDTAAVKSISIGADNPDRTVFVVSTIVNTVTPLFKASATIGGVPAVELLRQGGAGVDDGIVGIQIWAAKVPTGGSVQNFEVGSASANQVDTVYVANTPTPLGSIVAGSYRSHLDFNASISGSGKLLLAAVVQNGSNLALPPEITAAFDGDANTTEFTVHGYTNDVQTGFSGLVSPRVEPGAIAGLLLDL